MYARTLASGLTALSLALRGAASAQTQGLCKDTFPPCVDGAERPNDGRDANRAERERREQIQRERRYEEARRENARDHRDDRDWRRAEPVHPGYRGDVRYEGGAGPYHNWHRGSRLPPEYRSHHYVVDDWRGHRLSAPPRGYHWVQAGPDYLLVAIATGVIAQVLISQ